MSDRMGLWVRKSVMQCMCTWSGKQGCRDSLGFGIFYLVRDFLCKLNIILGFAGLKKNGNR